MSKKERLHEIEIELGEMFYELKWENKRAAWRLDTIIGKLQELQKILDIDN